MPHSIAIAAIPRPRKAPFIGAPVGSAPLPLLLLPTAAVLAAEARLSIALVAEVKAPPAAEVAVENAPAASDVIVEKTPSAPDVIVVSTPSAPEVMMVAKLVATDSALLATSVATDSMTEVASPKIDVTSLRS
jgi:hypothetical protein